MSEILTKKQLTHKKMLDAASMSFRRNGYAGIGVDGIAKAAGVTSGAFYAHFGSKDSAFKAALDKGLNEVIETLPKMQRESVDNWLENFVDYYLGRAHRDDLSCGCAMTTLSPEVVRAGAELHENYEKKMKVIAELIANGLKGGEINERIAKAWALLGLLTGGLTMARAVKTQVTSDEIAKSINAAAKSLVNSETSF